MPRRITVLPGVILLLLATGPRALCRDRESLAVQDFAFDDGTRLEIRWLLGEEAAADLFRLDDAGGRVWIGSFPGRAGHAVDSGLAAGRPLVYELEVTGVDGARTGTLRSAAPVAPVANWFDRSRLDQALVVVGLFAVILAGTYRKRNVFVRPIGGLKAMEEALGRAVEMGRPVLFSAGWGAQLDRPTTLAALNIFGWLARKAAEYGARLEFPTHDAVIMSAAQEAAQEAAQLAGKPEWYRSEDIYYVTGSQFGYAAALDGIMERKRPAANLWLGTFAAEALILSETGHHAGAMQIAGTDSTIQLAFFLVSCDYTLIGEEVFAASGYLTRDALVLGGVWAQDMLKLAVVLTLAAALLGPLFGLAAVGDWLRAL